MFKKLLGLLKKPQKTAEPAELPGEDDMAIHRKEFSIDTWFRESDGETIGTCVTVDFRKFKPGSSLGSCKPLIRIPINSRCTVEEAMEIAEIIRDRLNAEWTAEKLEDK